MTDTNQAPEAGSSQPPQPRPTGPVAKTFNLAIDTGYSVLWGMLTVLCIGGLIAGVGWWALAGVAIFGYFTYRNVSNIIVHKGND